MKSRYLRVCGFVIVCVLTLCWRAYPADQPDAGREKSPGKKAEAPRTGSYGKLFKERGNIEIVKVETLGAFSSRALVTWKRGDKVGHTIFEATFDKDGKPESLVELRDVPMSTFPEGGPAALPGLMPFHKEKGEPGFVAKIRLPVLTDALRCKEFCWKGKLEQYVKCWWACLFLGLPGQ
jgi:hypothetical protein